MDAGGIAQWFSAIRKKKKLFYEGTPLVLPDRWDSAAVQRYPQEKPLFEGTPLALPSG
jgi:hypothetical protein